MNKLIIFITFLVAATSGQAQQTFGKTIGEQVPLEVESMYKKGLKYLIDTQKPNGAWSGDSFAREPGVVGLAVLAILASGTDPNFGPYARNIKNGISFILSQQQQGTGMIGRSMYNHGFATLALAEAYGALNDPKLGPALEKAVKLLLSSQAKNPYNSWRYSPSGRDADTTAAGACMVALYAARNAGVGVPQSAIDKGIAYYKTCQSSDGGFGYISPGGSNTPRTAIGTLVYSLGRKKKSPVWKRALGYLKQQPYGGGHHYFYYIYYMPQALFQSDIEEWKKWNRINIKNLKARQTSRGSWVGSNGTTFSTSAALLSLALNYRFLPIYER